MDNLLTDDREASPNSSRDRVPKADTPLDILFSELGGPAGVGRMLGIATEHAAAMKRRGSIPIEHWPVMILSPIGKALGLTEARRLFAHTGVWVNSDPPANDAGEEDADAKVHWTSEDPDLVCNCQHATRVYRNAFNQVVICQEAHDYGEDDPFVRFQEENIPRLISALQRVAR
jgi:hypothetical protein